MKKIILSLATLCIVFLLTLFTAYAQINACYNNATGALRILVTSSSGCRPSETLIQLATQTEVPRIVDGTVNSDGTTILSGTGFSAAVSSPVADASIITFDPPFSQRPNCVVSSGRGLSYCSGTWVVGSPSSLRVECAVPEGLFLDGYIVNGPDGPEQVVLNVAFKPSLGPYSFVCVQD